MASFRRCDQCGVFLRPKDHTVRVTINGGESEAPSLGLYQMLMSQSLYGQQAASPTPLVNGSFELCGECGMAVAVALNSAKLRVQKQLPPECT